MPITTRKEMSMNAKTGRWTQISERLKALFYKTESTKGHE